MISTKKIVLSHAKLQCSGDGHWCCGFDHFSERWLDFRSLVPALLHQWWYDPVSLIEKWWRDWRVYKSKKCLLSFLSFLAICSHVVFLCQNPQSHNFLAVRRDAMDGIMATHQYCRDLQEFESTCYKCWKAFHELYPCGGCLGWAMQRSQSFAVCRVNFSAGGRVSQQLKQDWITPMRTIAILQDHWEDSGWPIAWVIACVIAWVIRSCNCRNIVAVYARSCAVTLAEHM